ncbi:MAG: hypothetical protein R3D57_16590 [Hyphomicrobiaceae bacterium]
MLRLGLLLCAFALVVTPARAETAISSAEAISLQVAMQRHIDQNLVDGALLRLDERSGIVRSYYPAKAHPKIMRLGAYYYMCASFRDGDGQEVMINFFMTKGHNGYVVFHTLVGQDEALEARVADHAPKLVN